SAKVISTCRDSGTFALTFDDGPYIYENEVSDFLSSRGIHGTFFINGYNYDCIYDQNIVDQLRHTFSQGHLIGSHTWSHPDITTLSAADFNIQLDLVETAMKKILGVKPRYFRPPFGRINDENLQILNSRGYKVVTWSFDSGDSTGASTTTSDQAYDEISKSFPTPQIALNHETHETTASEVSQHAVQVLQKAGYRLVSVSECLGSGRSQDDYYQDIGEPEQRDVS
ncbi:family 4 carbohydrate esterase, partial [Melampsora larici-populina 98AG31]